MNNIKTPLYRGINLIENGRMKRLFVHFNKRMKPWWWVALILLCILFSLLMTFITIGVENPNYKAIFKEISKVIVQVFMTGFSIGVSGFIIQRLTRNRLVDTSTIGVGNFCLIGLVIFAFGFNFDSIENQASFTRNLPYIFVPFAVFITIILYFFGRTRTNFSPAKLIICGLFVNFIAITLSISLQDQLNRSAAEYIDELLEAHYAHMTDNIWIFTGVFFGASLIWFFIRSPIYKIFLSDAVVARQLGIRTKLVTFELIIITGILSGIAYTLAGNILFVGIAAANIAYNLFGLRVNRAALFSGLLTTVFLLFSQFLLGTIVVKATSYPFNPPLLTPLLVAPIFIIMVVVKS
ncbi:iron ABC transporter permease [Ureaplasma canigenitalium]|uniref:iron ABC transporter permease n=1 Tax=Ureaplasma canigenitalium TaxID=42092 RepID=UPI00068D9D43|nr:iron ABC transporter permease [Ureaplasma canigenitalium]